MCWRVAFCFEQRTGGINKAGNLVQPPYPLKGPLSKSLPHMFLYLFDSHDILSDKHLHLSLLDVALPDLKKLGNFFLIAEASVTDIPVPSC